MFKHWMLFASLFFLSLPATSSATIFNIFTSETMSSENTSLSKLFATVELNIGETFQDNTSGTATTTQLNNGNGNRSELRTTAITVATFGESITHNGTFRFATYNNVLPGSLFGAGSLIYLDSVPDFQFSFGTVTLLNDLIVTTNCFLCAVGESVDKPFVVLKASLSAPTPAPSPGGTATTVPLPAGMPLLVIALTSLVAMRRRTVR